MANTAQVDTTFKTERRFGFFNTAITIAFCVAMVCLFATTDTFAKDYSFTWSANPEPVEGYKLYYKTDGDPVAPFNGSGADQGPSPITIGNQTTFTITGLDENATYYFALTAFSGTEESGFSDIIAVNVTSTDTTSPTPVTLTDPDAPLTTTDSDGLINQTTTEETVSTSTTEDATSTDQITDTTDTETQIPTNNPTDIDAEGATADINFELQEVQADYKWKTVTFSQPFVDPVVVAGPPSYANARPVTLRIRNVTSTDCQVRVDEYEYLSDKHTAETFNIIIMEKGYYTLDNGSKLEAGTFTGSTSFQQIDFQQAYTQAPVVLTQVLTENELSAVTGRIRTSTDSYFEYELQEQERNRISHQNETVGYIAWEPGTGVYAGLFYEVGVTEQEVTDSSLDISLDEEFHTSPDAPFFIAGMQTTAEEDTAAIRRLSLSNATAQIKIEEETSKDKETSHAAEVVGYITIGAIPEETTTSE